MKEEDWYGVMKKYIEEIQSLAAHHGCPILAAGDITDRWNNVPELANFLIKHIKGWYTIPGQHDLPNHSLDEIHRSTYWTLVEAGAINHLTEMEMFESYSEPHMFVHPFAWGEEIKRRKGGDGHIHICLAHKYIWVRGSGYPGAPQEARVTNLLQDLEGYNFAIFGDNHKGFVFRNIINCGTFMRRKIDEISYRPTVYTLHADGRTIGRVWLDCEDDVFAETSEVENSLNKLIDSTDFLHEIESLSRTGINFIEALKTICEKLGVSKAVRKIIMESSNDG